MFSFTKMHGCGNSFVLIYDQNQKIFPFKTVFAKHICHEHTGLGADGFILLEPSANRLAAFRMTYLNRDGSEGNLCGNGLRCAARYGVEQGMFTKEALIETRTGLLPVYAIDWQSFRVLIPQKNKPYLNVPINMPSDIAKHIDFIDTGVPHLVVEIPEHKLPSLDVQKLGAMLRWHNQFAPHGTNVNFISRIGENYLKIRTFERGVEGETLSCGTGVTAAALITFYRYHVQPPIHVQPLNGSMIVDFQQNTDGGFKVFLSGPTMIIAKGEINQEWLLSYCPELLYC
ncbi:MAG: diaminopimelate epimerase [Alphaproteobacteria bacterium]|nr:diaminopimelate epimerase [Alphaproteobacteria bacterium]